MTDIMNYKRRILSFLVAVCLFFGVFCVGNAQTALAAPPVTLIVHGEVLESDVPPTIVQGRTLLPIRAVTEALGADVRWDQPSQSVTVQKDDVTLVLKYKSNQYVFNDSIETLDVSIQMINNRIMVPLRVVGESFGYPVEWDDKTRTVTVGDQTGNALNDTEVDTKDDLNAPMNSDGPESLTGVVSVKTMAAAVYDKPSTSGEIIHEAKNEDRFDAIAKQGQWYKIILPTGREAWIAEWLVNYKSTDEMSQNTSPSVKPAEPAVTAEPSQSVSKNNEIGVEVTAPVVNIRRGPSTSTGIVTQVHAGDRFISVGKSQGWYNIKFNDGKTWWIFGELVKEIDKDAVNAYTTRPQVQTAVNSNNSRELKVKEVKQETGQAYVTFNVGDAKAEVLKNTNEHLKVQISGINMSKAIANPVLNVAPFVDMRITKVGEDQVIIDTTVKQNGYFRLDRRGDTFSIMAVAKHKNNMTGLAGKTVVISPGHGNYSNGVIDPGAIGTTKRLSEVDFNTPVAIKLKNKLIASGAKVLMVREYEPVYTTLYQRAQLANDNSADAFISIHGDSAPQSPSANGIGVYMYDGNLRLTSAAQSDMRKNYAQIISDEMKRATGANSTVRTANFAVLRENEVPSVLIECGFLSNPREEALLATDAYQEKLAQGMYNGLQKWFAN